MSEIEPRWLSASEAARYLGVDTEAFRRAVRRGKFPAPSYALGKQTPRWYNLTLERAMSGEDGSDIEGAVHGVVEEIQRQAQNRKEAARGRVDQSL